MRSPLNKQSLRSNDLKQSLRSNDLKQSLRSNDLKQSLRDKSLRVRLIALDTNILSYYFHSHKEFGEAAKSLVIQITTAKMEAITSSITLAELLAIEAPTNFIKNLEKEMLAFPGLKILEVSNKVAVKAGQIRREYKFKLADSIQLATAKIAKAQAFVTNDDRLKKFQELKIILLSEL